ncbi:hypothetical protein CLOM_g1168 [Closterium sp. NIES-68]|nr:hypothetical protein CLOM_g1168 [Closterium sp. NIES-68]GJP77182.1 hypothetical protein CLOP_g7611 [Closterium sp. NIES-67]
MGYASHAVAPPLLPPGSSRSAPFSVCASKWPLCQGEFCRSRTHSAGHHVPKLPKPNPSPPILSSWWCNKTSRMQPFLAWWHSEP